MTAIKNKSVGKWVKFDKNNPPIIGQFYLVKGYDEISHMYIYLGDGLWKQHVIGLHAPCYIMDEDVLYFAKINEPCEVPKKNYSEKYFQRLLKKVEKYNKLVYTFNG
jgi:hypothetical protein